MGSLAPCCPPSGAGSTHLPTTLPGCSSGSPSVERLLPNPVHATTWGPGRAGPSSTPAQDGLRTVLKASLQVGDEHESLKGKPAIGDSMCTHTTHTRIRMPRQLGSPETGFDLQVVNKHENMKGDCHRWQCAHTH